MQYIKWLEEIGIDDIGLVGGKGASLGEMYKSLAPSGICIPNGFVITSDAYKTLLSANKAWEKLSIQFNKLDLNDIEDLQKRSKECRKIILECTLPEDIAQQITQAFERIQCEYGDSISLAVRSSATAEDSSVASFAGQNETYLNIRSLQELFDA